MAASRVFRSAVCFPATTWKIRLNVIRSMSKMYPTDDEKYDRTTISLLSKESEGLPNISSYSTHGFTINGDKIIGPVAILPKTLVHWAVAGVQDITEESLSLFHVIEPKIEVLVLGIGSKILRLDPKLHKFMRSKGIALEIQDTAHACATFNYLVSESRILQLVSYHQKKYTSPEDMCILWTTPNQCNILCLIY
uniref:NADH dehydrogenase [ubiquinone] 1 alpha subcomplex assembly factor 3 n=1 Tax=Saccoglossus kowalevskii TaxID=10224 RepID=A0ABM0GW72_SACKO|nr:PREDICTED: NADH dehydrogenase [ubiquinone] 1 alpha subcomplex assembly factor 3-like [Saccoglossus kowalevskii]